MTGARAVVIPAGERTQITGDLVVPDAPQGMIVFAHGSGSSRHSPRNRSVAAVLHRSGFATLLVDLLTGTEEEVDIRTRHLRFDIELLAERLEAADRWSAADPTVGSLPVGLFGASTGAAAALVAAARRPDRIGAVVSRGGRPDLAADQLSLVQAPTLLVVGSRDPQVLELNRQAAGRMTCEVRIEVVEGASHLFEEGHSLATVAQLAADWLTGHLLPPEGMNDRK